MQHHLFSTRIQSLRQGLTLLFVWQFCFPEEPSLLQVVWLHGVRKTIKSASLLLVQSMPRQASEADTVTIPLFCMKTITTDCVSLKLTNNHYILILIRDKMLTWCVQTSGREPKCWKIYCYGLTTGKPPFILHCPPCQQTMEKSLVINGFRYLKSLDIIRQSRMPTDVSQRLFQIPIICQLDNQCRYSRFCHYKVITRIPVYWSRGSGTWDYRSGRDVVMYILHKGIL